MTVSVYKEREISGKTSSSALPKINVRPSLDAPQFPPALFEPAASSVLAPAVAAGRRPRAKDWDAGFAAALILIVIAVNATLTALLGGDSAPATDTSAIVMQPASPVAAQGDAKENETAKVYISSAEKRLLLRHLYETAPASRAAPPPVRGQGTYRSVSDRQKDALSITGAPTVGDPQ